MKYPVQIIYRILEDHLIINFDARENYEDNKCIIELYNEDLCNKRSIFIHIKEMVNFILYILV